MENYTIDLAQLGQRVGGAPRIGSARANQNSGKDEHEQLLETEDQESTTSTAEDFMRGYEINLGALGDKPSSVLVEDRDQQRDEVDSEDDGPDDFTVNLEKWMRGTEKWKKEQGDNGPNDGSKPERDPSEQVRDTQQQDPDADESVFEPLGTSTPAPLRNQAIIEDGVEKEAKLLAPPLSRSNTEIIQDRAAEEVFERISALQAEVERMQAEEQSRRLAHQTSEEENRVLKRDIEISQKRHEARDRALKGKFEELQRVHANTKALLQQENSQVKQDHEDAVKRLLLLEEQAPTDHSSELEPLRKMFEDAVQDLEAAKAEAETVRTTSDTKIQTLEGDLRASQVDLQQLRTELLCTQDAHNIKINELNAELEARKNEVALERKESIQRANELAELGDEHSRKIADRDEDHSRRIQTLHAENRAIQNELQHAQEQLTETRRIVDSVEEENDRLVQQNESQAQELTSLKATLKSHESKPLASEPRTENVSDKAARETLSQEHQVELSSLQAAHSKELQTLRSDLLKANQAMQKREAKLTAAHASELATLNQQLSDLKSQPTKTSNPIDTGIESELRSAIRVINTRLEKANASLKSARAETLEARQQLVDMQNTNAIVNAELEARFAEMVEAREREWRRRMRLLFRERDKMGKALMWG
ncbi:hypothetical protein P7C71_g6447, partial [Lecanoromycetidae sp. Uapishka_2]